MSKRGEWFWRACAPAAAFVYLVAMLAPWSAGCYRHEDWPRALAKIVTGACGAIESDLGVVSVLLCYWILVLSLSRTRTPLPMARRAKALSLTLVAITAVHILVRLPGAYDPPLVRAYRSLGTLGYGAWLALGSSLVLLLALSVLDAGGTNTLIGRLPAWTRLDRLETQGEERKRSRRKRGLSRERRRRLRWNRLMALALCVYLLSLFMIWWSHSTVALRQPGSDQREPIHLFGTQAMGELGATVAVMAAIVIGLGWRKRDCKLECARNALLAALALFTLLNSVALWRYGHQLRGPYQRTIDSRPDWGLLTANAAVLLLLVATTVQSAGDPRKALGRLFFGKPQPPPVETRKQVKTVNDPRSKPRKGNEQSP